MIYGHGDDAFRYGDQVKLNFSSNVYSGADLSGLKDHLMQHFDVVAHYPDGLVAAPQGTVGKGFNLLLVVGGQMDFRDGRFPGVPGIVAYGQSPSKSVGRTHTEACGLIVVEVGKSLTLSNSFSHLFDDGNLAYNTFFALAGGCCNHINTAGHAMALSVATVPGE